MTAHYKSVGKLNPVELWIFIVCDLKCDVLISVKIQGFGRRWCQNDNLLAPEWTYLFHSRATLSLSPSMRISFSRFDCIFAHDKYAHLLLYPFVHKLYRNPISGIGER